MKKVLYLAVITFSINMTTAQDFNKIGNLKNMSETVITGEMFKLIANIDIDSKDAATREMKSMIDKLTEVRVYKTENADSATKMKSYVDGYIKTASLTQLMYSKDDTESFSFYIKKGASDKKIRNLVMFINEGAKKNAESVFMIISGDLDLDQVSKITKLMNVPGQSEIEKATKSK